MIRTVLIAAIFGVFYFSPVSTSAQTTDAKLTNLRNQFAIRYMEPEAHFALAKYYLDRGDKLQAFYIIEYARRYKFDEKTFDIAHKAFFGDPMPEPSNEAKDAFELAARLTREAKLDEAEAAFLRSAKLGAKSFYINAWVGRFYFRTRTNSAKALPFYFDSYFLYPHAYETEFVESRIRKIAYEDAEAVYSQQRKAGKTPQMLSQDRNPLLVLMALEEMTKQWKPEYLELMLELMTYDDSEVRWLAFEAMRKNAGVHLPVFITKLLEDKDLRKRGLASYAVIDLWKAKGYEMLATMLTDDAELIRFDAISTLVISGGKKGKAMLRAHQRVEKNKRLKELIQAALVQKPNVPEK